MALPVSGEEAARRWGAIEKFPGNIAKAARSIWISANTLRSWARDHQPPLPQDAFAVAPPGPSVKPHYHVSFDRPDGRGRTKVLAIGDAHDGPRIAKDRFRWFGRLAAETRPDVIVQIGDFLSLDSLCRYEGNDTLKGKAKPSLKDDLDSFKEALQQQNSYFASALKQQNDAFTQKLSELEKKIDSLEAEIANFNILLAQFRGGSKVVFIIGSLLGGTVAAAIVKFVPLLVRI